MVVYYVVCFFPVLLLWVSSDNVMFVRIHSTSSVCLLHGLVLLPCGISGKMTIPSKSLLSLLLVARSFAMLRYLPPAISCLPLLPCQASNPPFLANRCLAMLPLCSAPLIVLLVAGEDWCLFLVGTWRCCSLWEHGDVVPCWNMVTCWDITIYLI